jgi:hypothetical protein
MEKIWLQYLHENKMVDRGYKLLSVMRNGWLIFVKKSCKSRQCNEKCHQSLVPTYISQVLQMAHVEEIERSAEPNAGPTYYTKDKLISMINHPLNLEQFEAEWVPMCDEFSLHDRVTMQALYNERSFFGTI